MDLKSSLAAFAGIVVFAACGGSHKLGDGTQATEGAGGADGGSAGGQSSQGGDPSAAGQPGFGGDPGAGGSSFGGQPAVGGSSFGGDPGAGGVSYGGSIGAGGVFVPNTGGYPPQSSPGIDVTGVGGSPAGDGGAGAPGNDLTGTWTGYVENHTFKSGSDALFLDLSQQSTSELTGHITFGDRSLPLASASDVVGPGLTNSPQALLQPLEGFAFTAMNGKIVGTRLEFDVAPMEAWNSICIAQTQSSCSYTVWDTDAISQCWTTVSGQRQSADCGVMAVCTNAGCACDPDSCFANTGTYLVHVDVALRSPYLDGSVAGLNETSVLNVHFSR